MTDESTPAPSGSKDGDPSSSFISRLRNLLFGRSEEENNFREALEEMIEDRSDADSGMGEEERQLLLNTLEFAEKRVEDVMIPRADVVAVEQSIGFPDLVQRFAETEMSRLLVYRETLDEVVGMVHVKDVFLRLARSRGPEGHLIPARAATLASILRPVLFVPSSMRLTDLLLKMRTSRLHMAVVVDEYGGTDGLVTNEDLVEQIVGEIEDEYDTADDNGSLHPIDDHTFEAGARIQIDDLEEALNVSLRTDDDDMEDVDSLGGLIVFLAGRVPLKGEVVHHPAGLSFEILDADPRRLKTVRIRREDPAHAQAVQDE